MRFGLGVRPLSQFELHSYSRVCQTLWHLILSIRARSHRFWRDIGICSHGSRYESLSRCFLSRFLGKKKEKIIQYIGSISLELAIFVAFVPLGFHLVGLPARQYSREEVFQSFWNAGSCLSRSDGGMTRRFVLWGGTMCPLKHSSVCFSKFPEFLRVPHQQEEFQFMHERVALTRPWYLGTTLVILLRRGSLESLGSALAYVCFSLELSSKRTRGFPLRVPLGKVKYSSIFRYLKWFSIFCKDEDGMQRRAVEMFVSNVISFASLRCIALGTLHLLV